MKVDILAKRVVLDTNIWLGAALSVAGPPALVIQRVLSCGVPVFSDSTFAELETRTWKPKFDRYLSIEARQRFNWNLTPINPKAGKAIKAACAKIWLSII